MRPSGSRNRPGALLWLLLALGVLAAVRWLAPDPRAARALDGPAEAPCPPGAPGCVHPAGAPPEAAPLSGDQVCPGAGYLCPGLDERGVRRIMRWNGETALIHVRVPTPPEEDRALALALQQAAARGIRAWDGHPFPLRVDLTDRPGPADFTVAWVARPVGSELGHARTEWQKVGDRADLRVAEFGLSFRSPFDPDRTLTPRDVQLSAAHEMGHALGLPHSDAPGDVMYPTNTALSLSARDYRTMEALYELPNGAEIRR